MSNREEREKHIEQLEALLEGMQRCEEVMSTPNRIKAIEYAISSIKTDLKYDLMHENDEDTVFLTKEAYADLCARASGIITEGTTKNDLGVDCISRKAALGACHNFAIGVLDDYYEKCLKQWIIDLPPITPIRPKGHWIGHREHCENLGVIPSGLGAYEWCSNCDCGIDVREWHRNHYNFCPNCGSDNREDNTDKEQI